jgi:hypothetical protein
MDMLTLRVPGVAAVGTEVRRRVLALVEEHASCKLIAVVVPTPFRCGKTAPRRCEPA